MSALLLIGLVSATAPSLPEAGAHLHLTGETLAALAIETSLADETDDAARMLDWAGAQNRILAHYIQTTDVLPVSLGAVFSDPEVLLAHLSAEGPALEAALAPLRGRSEYILRVIPDATTNSAPAMADGTNGAQFLAARHRARDQRRHRARDRRHFVQMLDSALAQWAEASATRDSTGKDQLWDVSLLVPRANADPLIAGLQDWGARADALDLCLRLVGPTPAYSFAAGRA
jgi:hypothetical protein